MKLNTHILLLFTLTSLLFPQPHSSPLKIFRLNLKGSSDHPSPAPASAPINPDHDRDLHLALALLDSRSPSPDPDEEADQPRVSLPPQYNPSTAPSPASRPQTLVASLESLLTIPETLKSAPAPPQVIEACNKTDYPTECEAALLPAFIMKGDDHDDQIASSRPVTDVNPHQILDSSVKTFTQALEIAKTGISNMKPSTLNADDPAVKTCREMYNNAIEELNKAKEAAEGDDKFGANIRLSAILTFIETCEDGLQDAPEDSSLVSANKMLSKLASNNLVLGNLAMGVDKD